MISWLRFRYRYVFPLHTVLKDQKGFINNLYNTEYIKHISCVQALTVSDPMETDMPSSETHCCPALILRRLRRRSCSSSRRLCTSRLLSARDTSNFSACKQIKLWYVLPVEGLSHRTYPAPQIVRQALFCFPVSGNLNIFFFHSLTFLPIHPTMPSSSGPFIPISIQPSVLALKQFSNLPAIHVPSHLSV